MDCTIGSQDGIVPALGRLGKRLATSGGLAWAVVNLRTAWASCEYVMGLLHCHFIFLLAFFSKCVATENNQNKPYVKFLLEL